MAHIQKPYSGLWRPDSVTTNKVDSQKMFADNIDKEEENFLEIIKRLSASVADVATLRLVNTSDTNLYVDGIMILCRGNSLIYKFVRSDTTSDDGITTIAPSVGGGRWKLVGTPLNHASSNTTYGIGTSSLFGHVKVSDSIEGSRMASSGVAASEYSVGYLRKIYGGIDNLSWSEIADIASKGYHIGCFSRGDKKTVQLNNGETISLVIADFDHDDLTTGAKAPISFIVQNCLAFTNTRYMNSTATNVGSWSSSYMRNTVMAEILAQLPSDLVNVIKSVRKTTTAGNQLTSIQTTTDRLWLPSCIEVGTVTSGTGYIGEGSLYPIFTDNNSRIKTYNGSANAWWLRSPYTGSTTTFHGVRSDGSNNNYGANATYGVVFGLCV